MSGVRWTEAKAGEWLHGSPAGEIRSNAVYYVKCLGSQPGKRWLDGRTMDGTAGLATDTNYPFTGTRWRAQKLANDAWAFRSLGEVPGAAWLDGRTATHTVGLADYPDERFTGTRWQAVPVSAGVYAFKCLGDVEGDRYLDGMTASGTVGLAPHPGYPYTGTHWELRPERWWVGCNFIPSTAINQLEMWQQESFDLPTIDRELGWARELGFNAVRVFLHDLLWKDPVGFKQRLHTYLDCAGDKHGIATLFVFFDDCWNTKPKPGRQPERVPDTHNSQWVQSPGEEVVADSSRWPPLEQYVTAVVAEFGEDIRVLGWDLYNEPGGGFGKDCPRLFKTLPLARKVFAWARAVDPTQPLTAGVFTRTCGPLYEFQLNQSDVISFHGYHPSNVPVPHEDSAIAYINELKTRRRPILCTEYMARGEESRFEEHLPLFNEKGVGCFNWGLVGGKTQTFLPWGYGPRCEWFHDILRTTGAPYSQAEVAIIKCFTGKERSGAGIQHNAIYRIGRKITEHKSLWLDGRTAVGDVGLAPGTDAPYTGTHWRALQIMEGVFAFRCLGDIEGDRWLDGRTHDGSVGLAPEPDHLHSGTRWQLCRVNEGVYAFRCLGDLEGKRFLDGRTNDGSVGLAPHTGRGQHPGPSFTGVEWGVEKLSDG